MCVKKNCASRTRSLTASHCLGLHPSEMMEVMEDREAGHGMEWNGKWNGNFGMEDARMEWNGRFQEWNGRQSSILPYQFHTRFRALYLQKNTYRCRVVINNIVTEVFNLNIYAYYLSTNRGTLVVYSCIHCANTVRIASL